MKSLVGFIGLVCAVLSLSLTSAARSPKRHQRSLTELAELVQNTVYDHANLLHQEDKILIRQNFRQILRTFRQNGIYPGQGGGHQGYRRLFCENGKLIDLDRNETVFSFTFDSQCNRNLPLIQNGQLFCHNAKLYNPDTSLLLSLTFDSQCESAKQAVEARNAFCIDGKLYDRNAQLIRRFTFNSECKRALQLY